MSQLPSKFIVSGTTHFFKDYVADSVKSAIEKFENDFPHDEIVSIYNDSILQVDNPNKIYL